jgi:hypothetical protein
MVYVKDQWRENKTSALMVVGEDGGERRGTSASAKLVSA